MSEIEFIEKQLLEETRHKKELKEFLESLNQQSEFIGGFDELLWEALVDKIEISSLNAVKLIFKDGNIVTV